MWRILTHSLCPHCPGVYTEVAARESTKPCHMLRSGPDLKTSLANSSKTDFLWVILRHHDLSVNIFGFWTHVKTLHGIVMYYDTLLAWWNWTQQITADMWRIDFSSAHCTAAEPADLLRLRECLYSGSDTVKVNLQCIVLKPDALLPCTHHYSANKMPCSVLLLLLWHLCSAQIRAQSEALL